MTSTLTHRMAMVVVVVVLVMTSASLVLGQTLQPVQPRQPVGTEPDDRPVLLATTDTSLDLPTRPSLPTPTPHPGRNTPAPSPTTQPRQTPVPTTAPTFTETVEPTAVTPNPRPTQPTIPPINQPTPTPVPPFIPGQNNLVEVTLYQCPAGGGTADDEAAFLAACPRVEQTGEMFSAFGVLADDAGGVYTWTGLDYVPGQLISEEAEYPQPGIDIPYPDRPAVFCGEGDGPRLPVPIHGASAIQPYFSGLSDVEYHCSWFKTPLTSNTVRVATFECGVMPDSGAPEAWYRDACYPVVNFHPILTDATGIRTPSNTSNEWFWSDVNFGATGAVQVALDFDQQVSDDARVFCGGPFEHVSLAEPAFTIQEEANLPIAMYSCRSYAYHPNFSMADELQIPNAVNVQTWFCPAGFDPLSPDHLVESTCAEPAPGVNVAVNYPGDLLAIQPTTGTSLAVADFGLMGIGTYLVAVEPIPGYEVFGICWRQAAHGSWRVPALYYTGRFTNWNWKAGCSWYFIPES